jgi:F-box and leucine-rich repeat protein GRR1
MLSNLTDNSVVALAQNCPNIRKLEIFGCQKVTDKGLIAVGTNCPDLQLIHVGPAEVQNDGSTVTDAGMTALVQGTPDLRTLTISKCPKVADCTMLALALTCTKLVYLDMTASRTLTDTVQKQ